MSLVPPWFQRRFTFDFPAEVFPNLVVRLSGTPARLEETLRDVPRDRLVPQPSGRWSIQEEAGHLLDLEPLWQARVVDFLRRAETLSAADLTNRKTHEARHNERTLSEILASFRGAREGLVAQLHDVEPHDFGRTALHPRLETPMRLVDHMYFVAEHDDHHLARILEMLRTPVKGIRS